jgi:hypothetical protein
LIEKKEQESTRKTGATELFVRPKDSRFDASDLPVIQNLLALDYTPTQVGMILGYQGDLAKGWKISATRTLGDDARQAINLGLQAADAAIVKNLVKEAFGYEWEEVKTTYKAVPKYDAIEGEESIEMVPVAETRTKKRQPGNAKLAELLAVNRLPDDFKKVSEVKKFDWKVETKTTEEQITELIGRLLDAARPKQVESTILETENE